MRRSNATHRSATGFSRRRAQGDDDLRREVESFLVHAGRADEFLGASTMQAVAHAMVRDPRSSLIGRQIGAYEVVEYIGAGGMGEVYRARDTKLQRDVALKVLPDAVPETIPSASPGFNVKPTCSPRSIIPTSARFTVSRNPNDVRALVLELVEGPHACRPNRTGARFRSTRRARLPDQIAAALEEAHRARYRASRSQTSQCEAPTRRDRQGSRFWPREGHGTRRPNSNPARRHRP